MNDAEFPEFDTMRIAVFDALAAMGDLPLEDTEALVTLLEAKKHPAGDVLFAAGAPGDMLYFIGAGRIEVTDAQGRVRHLSRGDMAGWPEVLSEAKHTARAVVQREVLLYELPAAKLQALLTERPAIALHLLKAVSQHATDGGASEGQMRRSQVVGVIAAPGLDEDRARQACAHYLAALPKDAAHAPVDFARFCTLLGKDAANVDFADPALADVIADLESNTTYLVLIAGQGDPEAWTRLIAASADQSVLLMHRSHLDSAEPGPLAPGARQGKLGLVLIAQDGPEPQSDGIAALQEALQPDWSYQIALGDEGRWGSIARMSVGTPHNLVLSGGGSFGAVHMGVLKALQEAGYPIDSVGGTSVGGAIAVGVGLGFSAEEIFKRFHWLFTQKKAFSSYALPLFGAINPRRYDEGLHHITDGRDFESFELPVFACVANLNTKNLDVIRSGPAWEGMRSTSSIPGALPAFIRNGHVLVDGGVLNNFPTRVALDLFGGDVTGMSLKLGTSRDVRTAYADRPSAFRGLMANFGLTKRRDFPTVGKIVAKTLVLSASQEMTHAMDKTEVLFEPQVPSDVSFMNFAALDRLFEVGYEYAAERLSQDVQIPD